jgi:hypothetical protein
MKDEQDKALDNLMAWQQEFDKPVAWITDDGKIVSNREKEKYDITFADYCIPLYASPQTKPLDAERLYYLHESFYGIDDTGQWNLDYIAFARAIEKEHGII